MLRFGREQFSVLTFELTPLRVRASAYASCDFAFQSLAHV
jgi:hypothetical protein